MLRSFRLSSCLLVLIFFCFDDGGVSVDGRRSYVPSHRRSRPHPYPHLYGTCVVGSVNKNTGLFMGRNEEESKYIGSTITEDERECAHKCCEEKDCSLSWFIAVEGGDEEDEDNCFLVNCDSPHHCRLKDSKLKDSVTHIFRKSSSTTITTTTTGSPRIDPLLKAIANYNLGSDEMKVLVDTLDDLDVKERTKIKVLIDSVLAEHGGKVSGSSKITTATTSEATPTKNTTITTTETTTTTSTTSTESPRMEKQLQPPRIHMGILAAACVIGVVITVIVLATMQGVHREWRKKDYIDADYLINGMYQPNI